MIASLVKTIITGVIGYGFLMAIGHKVTAKMIILLIALMCLNTVVQGCQPYIKSTQNHIEKLEQFMDRVYGVEEKTDEKLDKTESKIRKFLFEPPKIR